MKEILLYIQDEIKNDLDDLPAETINEYLSKYAGVIIKHFSSCSPETIQRFRSRQALAGVSQNAIELIDQVQITMFKYVTGKLKEQHGENWWYEGIPEKIRTSCSDRHEKEKGIKNKEQYLTIIDYQSIAHENWGLFEKIFSMSKDGGKEKKLKRVAELSVIRNITHLVEKWPATKEQVKFVRDVHQFVMVNFAL